MSFCLILLFQSYSSCSFLYCCFIVKTELIFVLCSVLTACETTTSADVPGPSSWLRLGVELSANIYVKVFKICLAKLKNFLRNFLSSHTTILTIYRSYFIFNKALKPLVLLYSALNLFKSSFFVFARFAAWSGREKYSVFHSIIAADCDS